jgi:hypothetical protein
MAAVEAKLLGQRGLIGGFSARVGCC